MKPRETRPGGVALDATSQKATTPGVTPRPPTVDDDATVPRRLIDTVPTEPVRSEPLLGASLPGDTDPGIGATLPDPPRKFGDTVPEPPRKEFPSASDLLAATPIAPQVMSKDSGFGALAKATPVIPERADSDGARNARFATEGAPARSANVTMPTGEVLVDPDVAEAPPVAKEVDLEALAEPQRRRAALPTVPAGHVIEREERAEYIGQTKRGIAAGVSMALVLLALLLWAVIGWSKGTTPSASTEGSATSALAAPSHPSAPVVATAIPSVQVVSPVPVPTAPGVNVAASAHPGKPGHSGHGTSQPAPAASAPVVVAPPVTAPAPVPVPVPAAPKSSVPDVSHNIN